MFNLQKFYIFSFINNRLKFFLICVLLYCIVCCLNLNIFSDYILFCREKIQTQICDFLKIYNKAENYFNKMLYFFSTDIDILLLKEKEIGINNYVQYNCSYLIKENNELKKLLNLQTKYLNKKPMFAKVLISFSNDYVNRVMLNVGKLNGISDSDVVMDCNCNLIGRLSKIYDDYSEVMLITDSNSNVPCVIKDKINCLLKGNNTNNPELIFINEDFHDHNNISLVNNDDNVKTSNIGGIFPKNINVGTLIAEKNAFFVKPFVDFNNIKYVMVFKNQDE